MTPVRLCQARARAGDKTGPERVFSEDKYRWGMLVGRRPLLEQGCRNVRPHQVTQSPHHNSADPNSGSRSYLSSAQRYTIDTLFSFDKAVILQATVSEWREDGRETPQATHVEEDPTTGIAG